MTEWQQKFQDAANLIETTVDIYCKYNAQILKDNTKVNEAITQLTGISNDFKDKAGSNPNRQLFDSYLTLLETLQKSNQSFFGTHQFFKDGGNIAKLITSLKEIRDKAPQHASVADNSDIQQQLRQLQEEVGKIPELQQNMQQMAKAGQELKQRVEQQNSAITVFQQIPHAQMLRLLAQNNLLTNENQKALGAVGFEIKDADVLRLQQGDAQPAGCTVLPAKYYPREDFELARKTLSQDITKDEWLNKDSDNLLIYDKFKVYDSVTNQVYAAIFKLKNSLSKLEKNLDPSPAVSNHATLFSDPSQAKQDIETINSIIRNLIYISVIDDNQAYNTKNWEDKMDLVTANMNIKKNTLITEAISNIRNFTYDDNRKHDFDSQTSKAMLQKVFSAQGNWLFEDNDLLEHLIGNVGNPLQKAFGIEASMTLD